MGEDALTDLPPTSDSGYDYGQGILDLFKFGVGAYANTQIAKIESKNRYDSVNGQLYMNGQRANPLKPQNQTSNVAPLLIGAAALVVVVLLLKA